MKKTILLLGLLLFCAFEQTFSQYPIPSYNVTVKSKANFQESKVSGTSDNIQTNSPLAKRDMEIKVNCSGLNSLGTCTATIWVYSLDGLTVLGPYTVEGGQGISVPIDYREWGVIVESDDNVAVDVWIE